MRRQVSGGSLMLWLMFCWQTLGETCHLTKHRYGPVAIDTPSYDPCNDYTSLDQPWRATNETGGSKCDDYFNGTGWYRLLYNGTSVRMPESCVNRFRCGTDITLWLNGSHPQIEDGIVTRGVCGDSGSYCCYYRSTPIQVKACPGNYYVYKFAKAVSCKSAYCADVSTIMPASTTTLAISTELTTTPNPDITVSAECKDKFTPKCGEDLFNQLEKITAQVLPQEVVVKYLDMVLNTQEQLLKVETRSEKLASYGNTVLNRTEKLVSTLVKPAETTDSVNISLKGLDIQVFAVGPKASLKKIPQISMNDTQMDIDLIQISKNNNGSAAVAFLSFSNMASMLKPSLFNSTANTVKTMMSIVVSATLPKTTNTQLTKAVNFTLKHNQEMDPNGTISCVYWNKMEWIVDGCYLLQTNSSHSVCSCVHLSTFALIMQTNPPSDYSDPLLELLNTVAVAVGLLFLSLSLLTFALCRQHLRVNAAPLINLCISLFLAHLLFLLTQTFLQYIQTNQMLCAAMAGVLHFLFLSAFVWMFFEAVLLLISVKNLTKIRSKQKEVLSWKYLIVIGYVIPLVVVGVSVGLFPDGYGSERCWIKTDRYFVWSFLGPVCFILTFNLIFFFFIIITLRTTMTALNSDISQIKQMRILVFKTLVQIVILGCPWILGFFVNGSKVLEIVFLFLNSQQGTFIFLVHCVLDQEVRQQYRKWLNTFCQVM
ncbi:adhesion G protein-coupled receptor E3-like [Colossoma macropomum]|uniref:adhesion G protein-coupled receptor E3-like n=1 Tax=Colossoma macropomum TaxID=42526 RepID=UPI001864F31A|nr:adhesion G protein-coupled receptor E3-like [Colossoma macropomum]